MQQLLDHQMVTTIKNKLNEGIHLKKIFGTEKRK